MSILLSVNPPYAQELVDGIKQIEWRKKKLPIFADAFIYETKKNGGCGAVIGKVGIFIHFERNIKDLNDEDIKLGCVSREYLEKYANGEKIFGHYMYCEEKYNNPKPISDFGLKRPPQSWCYVDDL